MYYSKEDITALDKVSKLKLINAVSGIKPANLIGSVDEQGSTNLAIFSSVVHLGSSPALLGFIVRPTAEVPRHTYNNIINQKYYTINHVHKKITKNAHYTSAKFDAHISEFAACRLAEEYIENFAAPFVKESNFKMGMHFKQAIEIPLNNTILIIGEIEHLILPDNAYVNNEIDLENTEAAGISGLNSYYELKKIEDYPYARVTELPNL